MKFFNRLWPAILISLVISSCLDIDFTTSVEGDVYYHVKSTGQDTLFAIGARAVSNVGMNSVSVTSESNPDLSFDLNQDENSNFYFYYEPSDTEFSSEVPTPGNYHFDIQLADKDFEALDQLHETYIFPAEITSVDIQFDALLIIANWNKPEGAESFIISVANEDGELVFVSQNLPDQTTTYSIDIGGGSWSGENPQVGDTFTVNVTALHYDGTSSRFQSISIASSELTWQE
jgi:hypothetical protein